MILSKPGLIHGLDRRSVQNSPIVAKAGEILTNSIKINELIPKKDEANNSYVLIGIAQDESGKFEIVESVVNSYTNVLESIDVLYSIKIQKKKEQPCLMHLRHLIRITAPLLV